MTLDWTQPKNRTRRAGFTLVEILVAFAIFGMASSALVYGYIIANRMAEWSSMSLAAQSAASQGAESARSANWRPRDSSKATGPGTPDELPPGTNGWPALTNIDLLDVPSKAGASPQNFSLWVTNYVWVATVETNPPLRKIRSAAIWRFPLTGVVYTNTVLLLRAPDQ